MRLTKDHYEQISSAIMADVPSVDYGDKMQSRVAQLVAKIRAAAGISPDVDLGRLTYRCVYFGSRYDGTRISFATHGLLGSDETAVKQDPKLQELDKKRQEQIRQREEMRGKLLALLKAYRTRATLAAALPEFEKYLPAEAAPVNDRTVPALVAANTLAELSRAGWPKTNK